MTRTCERTLVVPKNNCADVQRGRGVFASATYVLFSSFAFLPSFVTLGVGHFGSETGHIIVAVLGIPLHPALLPSVAKLLVLVLPLTRGPSKKRERLD